MKILLIVSIIYILVAEFKAIEKRHENKIARARKRQEWLTEHPRR